MFPLSTRVKESIKPALAFAIIYAISFYMNWDKPYWATVSAASVNLMCYGMTLNRGIIRVAATMVGGFVGLAIIGLFPQERWMYMLASTIPLFIWGYMSAGEKQDYLWVVGGITFMVVMGVSQMVPDANSGTSFDIVQLRISQTLMGSGIMVLISVYLWPHSTINDLENTVRMGWGSQRRLLELYRNNVLLGEEASDEAKQIRLGYNELQEYLHFLLHMSESDSFEMLEQGRHHWHHFLHDTAAQINCLESLRESLNEVEGLEIKTLLPDFEKLCSEVDKRFEQVDLMLAGEDPTYTPQPVSLSLNEAEMQPLSRFQKASVGQTRSLLEKLDHLSLSLFNCMADIKGFDRTDKGHEEHHAAGLRFTIDAEQLSAAFAVVTTIWIAFFVWIYVYDVPNGALFWSMTGIMAMIFAYRPEIRAWPTYWSWGLGTLFAAICYLYIMQYLDGFRELAAMIFIACFLIVYPLYPRPHPIGRMFGLISFPIVLSAEQFQHYSLPHILHYVIWLFLVISIALIVKAWFLPQRPEKFMLRLLDRFFRHANWLISEQAPGKVKEQGLLAKWKAAYYSQDLATLPSKMAVQASMINYKVLPGTTPDHIQELLVSVHALAYRVEGLIEAGTLPRAELIETQLANEKHDWHQNIERWFQRQSGATRPMGPPDTTLSTQLISLESRINDILENTDSGALDDEGYQHFHQLLGCYRSLAEAAENYARVSDKVDWPLLREMRFPV